MRERTRDARRAARASASRNRPGPDSTTSADHASADPLQMRPEVHLLVIRRAEFHMARFGREDREPIPDRHERRRAKACSGTEHDAGAGRGLRHAAEGPEVASLPIEHRHGGSNRRVVVDQGHPLEAEPPADRLRVDRPMRVGEAYRRSVHPGRDGDHGRSGRLPLIGFEGDVDRLKRIGGLRRQGARQKRDRCSRRG